MTEHPAYKDHPLWISAMEIAHRAYDLAEVLRECQPLVARHLRKAAVSVPARLAETLSPSEGRSAAESLAGCRGALAETERQARQASGPFAAEGEALAIAVRDLEGRILLELSLLEERPC